MITPCSSRAAIFAADAPPRRERIRWRRTGVGSTFETVFAVSRLRDDDIDLTAVYDGKEATPEADPEGLQDVSDHGSGDESGGDGDDEKYLGYSAQELALARELFANYDAASSGSINATELHKLFTNLGEEFTLANVQKLIKAVDTDGNGEVDFDEFLHLLRKQQDKNQYSVSLSLGLLFDPSSSS